MPGRSDWGHSTQGVVDVGVWFDAKAEYQSRKQRIKRGSEPRPRKDFETEYEIALSPLPCWEQLSSEERQVRAKELVEEIERMAQERRRRTKKRPLGVPKILAQDPHEHPKKIAKSAAPMVHASSRAERRNFADRYYRFVRRFRSASRRYVSGDLRAVDRFPRGCFIPRPPIGIRWAPHQATA